eukprot:789735-Pleurochrysis_carterae.AAC.1
MCARAYVCKRACVHACVCARQSRAVLRLALPAVTTNALTMLLQLVDAAFVGRLGAAPLAAAALGSAVRASRTIATDLLTFVRAC